MKRSPMHQAAHEGCLAELRSLIAQGAEIDGYDGATGYTPLMTACLSAAASVETVRFLLEQGADVNACIRQNPEPGDAIQTVPVAKPEAPPLIMMAIEEASVDTLRLLIEHGADLNYRSATGYTLLIYAALRNREEVIDLLVAAGAPLDGQSDYKESALSVLSRSARFQTIGKLLAHGADPAPLQWSPLMRAIALGTLQEVEALLEQGPELETTDFWSRTPFLLSVHSGDPQKAALLLAHGANRAATGRCGKPATHYPLDRDDARMLAWLIEHGFDWNQTDEFKCTPLHEAVEVSAVACFDLLLSAGADWRQMDSYGYGLIRDATHPEIIRTLLALGADPAQLDAKTLRAWIGLGSCDDLPISEEEFVKNRTRRFGTTNPELMEVPFWQAMVRCGWSGYHADQQFGKTDSPARLRATPVWCHQRYGMSLTILPDGRFIQIGGEHEDSYDPDFCIYNDVIIHDGRGGFKILGYPKAVFPPTDFHSATLVGPWIYIIGRLGYAPRVLDQLQETPVYRLQIETGRMEKLRPGGQSPGWIHRHQARLVEGKIEISGGKILTLKPDGTSQISDHIASYMLQLEPLVWRQSN